MAFTWTKLFSSADDGSVLTGEQLGTLQADVENNAVDTSSSQTVAGAKTFSDTVTFNGAITNVAKVTEIIFWEDEIISWEDELIYYR
jgi:hypothetical protein